MSGYVKFEDPIILHGGLTNFKNYIPNEECRDLVSNGRELSELFENDRIPSLANSKIHFTKKYQNGMKEICYITVIKGYKVALLDIEAKDKVVPSLPEELFEI